MKVNVFVYLAFGIRKPPVKYAENVVYSYCLFGGYPYPMTVFLLPQEDGFIIYNIEISRSISVE